MMLARLLIVGCSSVAWVCAFEYTPFPVPGTEGADAAPIQPSITAGNGITLTIAQRRPATSSLSGGVEVIYERLVVACDAMDFSQSAVGGVGESVLDHGRVSSGPKGPTPDRVRFDSRGTRIPTIGFRGLLTPASALLERLPAVAPAAPQGAGPTAATRVTYRLVMHQLGDWSGDLRGKGGEWMSFAGWGERAEVELDAAVLDRGLGQPRLRSIKLHGAADGKRRAELRRLGPAAGGAASATAAATPAVAAPAADITLLATWIHVQFDERGEASRVDVHDDVKATGNVADLFSPLSGQ